MKRYLLLCGILLLLHAAQAQTSYTWTGATSTSWTTATNWSPNGVPGGADNVTVVTGSNTCKLAASVGINNLTLTSGTLDLNAGTLTVTGPTVQFTAGTVQNGTLTVSGATTTVFGNGPVTMNCAVNITSAAFTAKNTTFQSATTITKTGASNDASSGGNTFNGALIATNAGSGYLLFGNGTGDQFNAAATFNNTGSANIYVGYNGTPSVFNGVTTFNNTPTAAAVIYVSPYPTGTVFSNNIIVNSTSGNGVQFCTGNGTATATIAAGYTLSAGGTGFSAGTLVLRQFTCAGANAQTVNLTGTATLQIGPSAVFNGNLTSSSPSIFLNGGTFNGTTNLTKTGAGSDWNQGGNIFNGVSSITNSGSGYLVLGGTNPDIWNTDVTFTDNGSERILPGWSSVGNQFNGNIYVNTSGSAIGIEFSGGNATATSTLAAGKTIVAGGGGLTAGYLYLRQFTQLGSTAINLTGTGTSAFYMGPSSNFGGAVTASAADIYFNGAVFNATVNATKTGAGNDYGSGGNTFMGVSTFTATGAGSFSFGNGNPDTWNNTVSFNANGTGYIGPCWNSVGNQFNGNIVVSSTGTATGVYFCNGTATASATMAAGDSISIGAGGFSSGTLSLRQFTQLGTNPTNLTLTGATSLLQIGPSSTFNGDFNGTSPRILVNGATYNDTTILTKTGVTGEWSSGGNTFNSTLTVNQQGGGFFGFANVNPDIYNGDVYVNNNSTERVIFANNAGGGTQFNGNIIVTQIGSSVGIAFGWGGSTNVTQAAGKTFTIGAAGFTTGYLQIERFTQLGGAPITLNTGSATTSITFGPATTIGGTVTTNSGAILFNGGTFNGSVYSTKTGATNDWSTGGNIFNDSLTVTDAGSGYVALANTNPDQINGISIFNNTGSANMYLANNSSNNIFGGAATFNNAPTGNTLIYVSQNSTGTVFNGNVTVTSTNGQGIYFCTGNTTATATLSSGDTLEVGPAGFSSGVLYLKQFTALGSAPTNLTLTGATTLLAVGPASAFGGDFTAVSPRILLNGSVFADTTILTKTGATGEWSFGGNTFNSTLTINQQGDGFFGWENSAADIFNGDVYINNNSTERVIFGNNTGGGTQFNGNLILTQTGGSVGIAFGWSASSNATMAAGKTITLGAAGFNTGYLQIERFTQLGSAAVNLPLTGASALTFGPSSAIGGNMTSTSGSLNFNGCTFSGVVNATKTGTTNDWSSGSNVFNGVTTITDNGSGYMVFGSGNSDQFNNDATFNNTGAASLYVAYNSSNNVFGGTTTFNNAPTSNQVLSVSQYSTGTAFNGNIIVTSTSGQGVQFCTGNGTATATLSAGYTITVGAAGFSAGTLWLRQFAQSGPTPQSLTLTGTGVLTFGPLSAIGGNIVTVSPSLLFNGCTFSGTVNSAKNGASSDASSGNNTFNGAFTVTNTGAGYFIMGNGNPDTWNSTALFNNNSTANHMYIAYNSAGNTFNGDVTFNNQPLASGLWIYSNYFGTNTTFNGNVFVQNIGGAGVYFGTSTGNATLATGSISAGAAGFTSGSLILRNFTQSAGGAAQTITLTGTGTLQYGPGSNFNGAVTSTSPGLLFDGCVFNGTVNSTKNGSTSDQSTGNNTFNSTSVITNTNGSGYLMMTNTTADIYNGNMTFVQAGAGKVYPNYNNNSSYNGNLTVTSPAGTAITFGAGSGTATFSGSGGQTIALTAGATPVFTRVAISNSGPGVTLNSNINVSNNIVFNTGLLNTATGSMLVMLNGSLTSPGNALSTSYVNGPMQYQKSGAGTTTLNFPIGNGADCRPFVLTASHTNGTLYTYTATLYDASAQAFNWTLPLTVDKVSQMHYWVINRADAAGTNQPTAGLSGNQTIQLFFGANDVVSNGGTLTVCKNVFTAPTTWIDVGGAGGPVYNMGAALTGSITSTSAPSAFNSFSTFTLGDRLGGANVLPIGLLNFTATPDHRQVDLQWTTSSESNNSYFTLERSNDDVNFDSIARVATEAPDGNSNTALEYTAVDPRPFTGRNYYRLRQTDRGGVSTYSRIVTVDFGQALTVGIYPNPSRGTLTVTGLDPNSSTLVTQWFDLGGKLLIQSIVAAAGGSAGLQVDLGNGMYLLKITFPDGTYIVQNIIILK